MAGKDLIIDDDFCKSMGGYFASQGEHMENVITEYISILQEIRNTAITSGDVADALTAYITYVSKLKRQMRNISSTVNAHINNFLMRVDSADEYLF